MVGSPNRRSWLVVDRREPSGDAGFFVPQTFLRGAPLPAEAAADDIAYMVSQLPDLGSRLRGWALVREVDRFGEGSERRSVLQFAGALHKPVPLDRPGRLGDFLARMAEDRREWQCWPEPLADDDIELLNALIGKSGVPLPGMVPEADQGATGIPLSAVLAREMSDGVRSVFLSAIRVAEPKQTKGAMAFVLDLRSVARALIHHAIENEAKPINYPGTRLTPAILAQKLKAQSDPGAFREEILDAFERTGIGGFDPNLVEMSEGLGQAIDLATNIARRATKKDRISLRHLTAAMLLAEGAEQDALRSLWRERMNTDIRAFAPEFLRAIEASPSPTEDMAAWRDVLAPALKDRPADRVRYHTAYGADMPDRAAKDSLDITADVEAFAELICLESAKPPISIGLFGDWGSGKSFFMEKLSQRIEQLTAGEAGREGSPFVGNVVQIRFNAWTYADSENLWASLTAEFFDQLRAGGFAKTGDARYHEVVNAVRSRVAMAADDLQSLKGSVSAIAGNIEATNRELAALAQQRKSVARDAAASSAGQALLTFIEANRDELSAVCRQLGLDVAPEKLMESVEAASKTAADWFGRLKLTMSAVWRNRGDARTWISLLFGAVLLAIAALLPALDQALLRKGIDSLIAVAIAALSTLPALVPTWKLLRPLFVAGDRFRQDVEARRRDIDKQIEALRASLAGLESEAKKAADEQAARAAFIARYEAGAQGRSPAALLHFFLHGSEATREYDKHLGLVSRVRRSFEVLNALMLRPDAGGGHGALPSIDRIVLYIDDLDRCRDAQVVQVLEAVHLLLAFPLFVVVVGVDARWLQHSLAKHYDEQLSAPNRPEAGKATVTDYLEKIFQIPFWLRPLSMAQEGKDGTYERLIDDLTARPAAAPTSTTMLDPQENPPHATTAQRETTQAGVVDPASINTPLPLRTADTVVLGVTPAVRSVVEVRKAVELIDAEVELMKAMGSLVGKSPRAVKRFINLYRLIRARRAGEELEAFLGRGGGQPAFPAAMFLLALDSGLAATEADAVHAALVSCADGEKVAAAFDVEKSASALPAHQREALARVRAQLDKAVAGCARANGGQFLIGHLAALAAEARRYSFRPRASASVATAGATVEPSQRAFS